MTVAKVRWNTKLVRKVMDIIDQHHGKRGEPMAGKNGAVRYGVFGAIVLLGLTGCDETGNLNFPQFGGAEAQADDGGQSIQLVERDVEAPDVFQVTDSGLWDGRPSLGGVWVAHPDVVEPERVIIRNQSNGKFVIGALFRRERAQAGPELQVSSDAALALDMLAGSPTALQVTALRREEAPVEAPAPVVTFDEGPEVETLPLDPIANAAAAIETAEAAQVSTAPLADPAPVTSTLTKPFIQIGIFSVKDNADRTAALLSSNGITPSVLTGESSGRAFWRVVVGPSQTSDARTALLNRIKGLGFEDAYPVTN